MDAQRPCPTACTFVPFRRIMPDIGKSHGNGSVYEAIRVIPQCQQYTQITPGFWPSAMDQCDATAQLRPSNVGCRTGLHRDGLPMGIAVEASASREVRTARTLVAPASFQNADEIFQCD